ncbi:MAG: ABC transporter ATP-binding protein [Bacillaceae bacterium]
MDERRDLKRLLRYALPHKKLVTIAFLLLFGATAAEMAGPLIIKYFIDEYLVKQSFPQETIIFLFSLYMVLHILKVILTYFRALSFQSLAFQIVQEIRVHVYESVQKLSMKYFDRTPIGSIVSRITNDTEAIKEFYVSVLSTFLQNGVFLIGLFGTMFILDYRLALACLVIVPIIYWIMYIYRQKSKIYYHRMRSQLSALNARINESVQGMTIIQLFRQQKRMREEFEEINEKHYEAGMKNLKLDSLLLRPAIDLVYIFAIIIVITYFGWDTNTAVEVGVLFAFVNLLDRFFEPINEMMQKLALYQQALVASNRVFEMMDEQELSPSKVGKDHPHIEVGTIEFKDVSFSYDGVRPILKNISFRVEQGQTVAFVGHTGSGKSTIMNLLLRFYEPASGTILLDETEMMTYDEAEIRQKMGLVLQDPFVFTGTIRDNIVMYEKGISDEKMIEAAKFVQAHEFIQQLDGGYDAEMKERGATLSSGQKQLITFARTMVKEPKILVLDEATATVDTETEEHIQTALSAMRKGRTTLIIAHRLSTIQDADCIFVLHDGQIVERGTHQELLQQMGRYYNMYLLQNNKTSAETLSY